MQCKARTPFSPSVYGDTRSGWQCDKPDAELRIRNPIERTDRPTASSDRQYGGGPDGMRHGGPTTAWLACRHAEGEHRSLLAASRKGPVSFAHAALTREYDGDRDQAALLMCHPVRPYSKVRLQVCWRIALTFGSAPRHSRSVRQISLSMPPSNLFAP
jgi:hypothetical protein